MFDFSDLIAGPQAWNSNDSWGKNILRNMRFPYTINCCLVALGPLSFFEKQLYSGLIWMNCRTSLTWKQLKLATIWFWEWLPLLTIIPVTENSDIIFNSDMLCTLWYPLGRPFWLLFSQTQLGIFNSSAGPGHWRVPQQKMKKKQFGSNPPCLSMSIMFLSVSPYLFFCLNNELNNEL